MTTALNLFPYQEQAIAAVKREVAAGTKAMVLKMPTGSGKTVVAAALIPMFKTPMVFMCHRDELVEQTRRQFTLYHEDIRIAICKAEQGRTVEELIGRDVIIASAQTLARQNRLDVLKRALGGRLPVMVVDECHHSAADTWRRAMEYLEPEILIGLSATPKRGDGKALDDIFELIAYSLPMSVLVDGGRLARPIGLRIGTGVDLTNVATRTGDFAVGQLEEVVNVKERNDLVVESFLKHAWPQRSRAIAFCVDIEHVKGLTYAFQEAHVAAEMIIGDTSKEERRAIYERFSRGETNVLISCMVLTEGFDEPLADCALMCRPTQSQPLYIQMAGRVLRHAAGKHDALIIDFVDATTRHQLHSITSLAGDEDPATRTPAEGEEYDLFGEVTNENERRARIKRATEMLGDILSRAEHVWHASEDGVAFAPTGEDSWIAVIREDDGFIPVQVWKSRDRYSPATMQVLFNRPADAQTAMEIATAKVPANPLTAPKANWRGGEASPAQKDFARKLKLAFDERISKGELSGMIDRVMFDRAYKQAARAR